METAIREKVRKGLEGETLPSVDSRHLGSSVLYLASRVTRPVYSRMKEGSWTSVHLYPLVSPTRSLGRGRILYFPSGLS